MSSAESSILQTRTPTTIEDLPPEIITSIYKHLDTPSSATAISSTCYKYHVVWQSNAASISSAAIHDNIPYFSHTLELQKTQEKVRAVNPTTSPPPIERLQDIQHQARNTVERYQTEGHRGISLSNGDYNTTVVRTKALVSIAKKPALPVENLPTDSSPTPILQMRVPGCHAKISYPRSIVSDYLLLYV